MSGTISYGEGQGFRRRSWLEQLSLLAVGYALPPAVRRAFETALWIATAGRGLKAILPGGEVVRLAPSCRHTKWNPEEYRAFRAATRPGAVVLDLGANTGAYTVLFAQWVGPTGRVIAFEPVPSICSLLRRQVALNGVEDRVEIVNAAAAAADGTVRMIAPGTVGINRVVRDEGVGLLSAPSVTIDSFCAERDLHPDVIKIDVEGLELDVLRGARQTLASCRDVAVFAEWHPSIWPSCSISALDIEQELARQGFCAEALRASDDVWSVEGICARLVRR